MVSLVADWLLTLEFWILDVTDFAVMLLDGDASE